MGKYYDGKVLWTMFTDTRNTEQKKKNTQKRQYEGQTMPLDHKSDSGPMDLGNDGPGT